MKIRMFQWFLLAALVTTAHALWGWGALALMPELGPIAEQSAQREGALTWTYMQGGRWAIRHLHAEDAALRHAEAVFAPAREGLLETPRAAMDQLHRRSLGVRMTLLRASHWGAPLLWLLTAIAYARRQTAVVTTRRLR